MQRNISSRDSVPQKLNTKGKEILKKDSSLFVTTDENTEKFLNTYAKVNFVKADGDLSIMSPNVWPRNILCICTLIIGLEPRSGYYDLYCKVDSRLKSYRTHLKIAIGWDQEESAEILDDAIREHAATTFKKYREILILAEDPSVFLNGKEEVLMVWLNELEEYI